MAKDLDIKIILRPHLKIRLKERQIPQNYPSKIVRSPDNKYYDTATNHLIAVKRLEYHGKVRSIVVAYDIMEQALQIITIHPISGGEIQNKLKSGRWIKHEKN